jgi:hypothetical protein
MERLHKDKGRRFGVIAVGFLLAGISQPIAKAEDLLNRGGDLTGMPTSGSLAPYIPLAKAMQSVVADETHTRWSVNTDQFSYLAETSSTVVDQRWEAWRQDPAFKDWWEADKTQKALKRLYEASKQNDSLKYLNEEQFRSAFLISRIANNEADLLDTIKAARGKPYAQFCIMWFTCGFGFNLPKVEQEGRTLTPLEEVE